MTDQAPGRLVLYALRQAVIVSLLAGTAAMTLLVVAQRRVMYPLGYGARPTPVSPPGYSTARVDTPSGRLLVWRHAGRPDRPVLLFMHGNATGIDGVAFVARPFVDAGWSVVAPEYPGYPGSPGSPSEAGLVHAARAGWRIAIEGRDPGDVLVMGNSIGSGPAIALAAETKPRGLAVISGIAYLPQVVRGTFPFIPDLLVLDRYRNAETLARVAAPVMVVHGRSDDIVDISQGRALAGSAHVALVETQGGHEIMGRRDIQTMVLKRFDR